MTTIDLLRERAEDEFQRFFLSQTVLYGATVAYRSVHAMWSYSEEVRALEVEIKRLQEELKTRKKMAELQGRARRMQGLKGLVVTFAK